MYINSKTILNLSIKKKWFDLILSGEKVFEYREYKNYWFSRIAGNYFYEVFLKNGYRKDAPFMRIRCLNISIVSGSEETYLDSNLEYYKIHLGEILGTKNIKKVD